MQRDQRHGYGGRARGGRCRRTSGKHLCPPLYILVTPIPFFLQVTVTVYSTSRVSEEEVAKAVRADFKLVEEDGDNLLSTQYSAGQGVPWKGADEKGWPRLQALGRNGWLYNCEELWTILRVEGGLSSPDLRFLLNLRSVIRM